MQDDTASGGPIGLSGSEERLVAYIRDGKLDAEIAVRLGLTVGDVRERTRRLLDRLGLPDRAALARWDGTVPPAPAPAPEVAAAGSRTESAPSTRPPAAVFGGLAIVLIGAGLAVVALFAGSRGGGDDLASPEVDPSPLPAFTSTPVPTVNSLTNATVGGIPVTQIAAAGAPFTADTIQMLVLASCHTCQAPDLRLQRVYKLNDAPSAIETLFEAPEGSLLTSVESSFQPGRLYATTCWPKRCDAVPGVETVIHRSDDGGVTWSMLGTVEGAFQIAVDSLDGLILRPLEPGAIDYVSYPSGAAALPAGSVILGRTDGGDLVYRVEGSADVTIGNFTTLLPVPETFAAGDAVPVSFLQRMDSGEYLVTWEDTASSSTAGVVVLMSGDEAARAILAKAPVESRRAILFGNFASSPGALDLDTNTLYTLPGPWTGLSPDAYHLKAVSLDPFVRVSAVDMHGDCLGIRSAPNADAVACVAERTHLELVSTAPVVDGANEEWYRVSTPAGVVGWAPAKYLDSGGDR